MQMSFDSIIDSIKDRLKSPYFFSVLVVWLGVNRKVIFGICNFEESKYVDDRVIWVVNALNEYKFPLKNTFTGLTASITWAFLMGFVVMVGYKVIGTAGAWIYHHVEKLSD